MTKKTINLDDEQAIFSNRFTTKINLSQGKAFSFDHDDMRTLHFDGRYIQSAMSISAPNELLLSYTKAMMFFLLAKPEPTHILMVGLGGGSLAKYCFMRLPKTKITVIEINQDVINLRNEFCIPRDDIRFKIIHADARDYLSTTNDNYDVILLDGFDVNGISKDLTTEQFYTFCKSKMTIDGLLVSNLFGTANDLDNVMLNLYKSFSSQIFWIDPSRCINRVAFSTRFARHFTNLPLLVSRAKSLDWRRELGLSELIESVKFATNETALDLKNICAYNVESVFMP